MNDDLVPVEAPRARALLRRYGHEPMEGSGHPAGEFWISERGRAAFIPYFRKHDSRTFLLRAVVETILREM
ncbi:MAG: hypothetical protein OXC28_02265 [Defluviicoccus sp.]|nr:hypothetical protein [Defluviicoccus sp.]